MTSRTLCKCSETSSIENQVQNGLHISFSCLKAMALWFSFQCGYGLWRKAWSFLISKNLQWCGQYAPQKSWEHQLLQKAFLQYPQSISLILSLIIHRNLLNCLLSSKPHIFKNQSKTLWWVQMVWICIDHGSTFLIKLLYVVTRHTYYGHHDANMAVLWPCSASCLKALSDLVIKRQMARSCQSKMHI